MITLLMRVSEKYSKNSISMLATNYLMCLLLSFLFTGTPNLFPAVDGVAWKTHFGGHRKSDDVFMDFFAYSYIRSNEYGEITHWETHVNSDYNDFLDVAIGEHGPYRDSADRYMQAVSKKLLSAGIDLRALMHKHA